MERTGIFHARFTQEIMETHHMKAKTVLAFSLAAALVGASGSAMADVDGKKLFQKKCGNCHSMDAGTHKIGPSLNKVIGRKAGSTDYPNYKALKGATFTWDVENMGAWITDPKKFIGRSTAMTVKIKKAEDRAAIIGYLTSADD